jgi:hypothetical protein
VRILKSRNPEEVRAILHPNKRGNPNYQEVKLARC